MPTALPVAPDMSAIRRKILQQQGQNEAGIVGMQYDPQWDQLASTAYGNLGTVLSRNDLSGQRLNQDYETARAKGLYNQENTVSGLKNRFADQGNLFSGAYVDTQADTGRRFQDMFDQLATGRTRGLEDIDRSNTGAMADYQRQIGGIEQGYSQSVQKYLADQAQKKAQQEQLNAQAAAQRAIANQNQDWQGWLYKQQQGQLAGY